WTLAYTQPCPCKLGVRSSCSRPARSRASDGRALPALDGWDERRPVKRRCGNLASASHEIWKGGRPAGNRTAKAPGGCLLLYVATLGHGRGRRVLGLLQRVVHAGLAGERRREQLADPGAQTLERGERHELHSD